MMPAEEGYIQTYKVVLNKLLSEKLYRSLIYFISDIDKYDHKTIFPDSVIFQRFVYKDGTYL